VQYSDLLGTPFVRHGRSKEGIDCLGIVLEMYRRAGIDLPDPVDTLPEEALSDHGVISDAMGEWEDVVGGYRELDVIVFRDSTGKIHVGVLVSLAKMIHATENNGVIVSPLRYKQQSIQKVYRYRCRS
jgi:cell wall-associated NlpC family hydrolase